MTKICPNCHSKNTKKIGVRNEIQRYKCNDCNKKFQSERRPKKLEKSIFKQYINENRTLKNLAKKYHKSNRWVYSKNKEYEPQAKVHNPRPVNLLCDATFYGERKDKLGILAFIDSLTSEVLIWKHIQYEKISDYKYLLQELLNLGYTIRAVTIDGKRGLFNIFKEYPTQMCQFHQHMIVTRYITKKPKLEASIELQQLMRELKNSNQTGFTQSLDNWHTKYKDFLNEKTINPITDKSTFTHRKLRSAHRSLISNLPYLFTYQNYKELHIKNTSNLIEGGVFSQLKTSIRNHRGLSKSLKLKIVDYYLVNYKKNE